MFHVVIAAWRYAAGQLAGGIFASAHKEQRVGKLPTHADSLITSDNRQAGLPVIVHQQRNHRQIGFWCLLISLWMLPLSSHAVPAGTVINNMATASFNGGMSNTSNTISTVTVTVRTPSTLEFLQYAPGSATAQAVPVTITGYSTSGTTSGPFVAMPAPTPAASATPIDLSKPVPLEPVTLYHQGDPIFVRLTDLDQNQDATVAETVLVTLSVSATTDSEVLRLTETGPNSGVFTGYIQSYIGNTSPGSASRANGQLGLGADVNIAGNYIDAADATDSNNISAMVDPYGRVFDSTTGQAVNGAQITIINATTNLPATVYGDDGISSFPSSITSGGTATDSSGTVYTFATGQYRFPFVKPGTYRLQITPPVGYKAPSVVPNAVLQSLPGAPFSIDAQGSYGQSFTVPLGPAIQIDIPIDPGVTGLFLTKQANKQVVAVGDFLGYRLRLTNNSGATATGTHITDTLPVGLRYQTGSTTLNGNPIADPVISADGRTLSFNLNDINNGTASDLHYVVQVTVGSQSGDAINRAIAGANGGALVSNQSSASVHVEENLIRTHNILMGRVIADDCGAIESNKAKGLAGVRIYLEDGTYVVTDEQGMYHIEGVKPGSHVLQMDLDTLSSHFEPVVCDEHSRFAGRSFSRFIHLQGGSLWRADFHVKALSPPTAKVELKLNNHVNDYRATYHLTLQGGDVPLHNMRLMINLPPDVQYLPGSSVLNNKIIGDPEIRGPVLIYKLDKVSGIWQKQLNFHAKLNEQGKSGLLLSKAFLMFDSPGKVNQRTPVVKTLMKRLSNGKYTNGEESKTDIVVVGIGKNQPPADRKTSSEEVRLVTMPKYDKAWVETAKPGVELLWPKPDYVPPIPSIKIAVKHDPSQQLTLLLNGERLNSLNYAGQIKNTNGTVAISQWAGVDIEKGDNSLVIEIRDAAGKLVKRLHSEVHFSSLPVRAELVEAKSRLVADGKQTPVIAVRLFDKDDHPIREGLVGEFRVESPYVAQQNIDDLQRQPLAGLDRGNPKYRVGKDGVALIELKPTSRTGEARLWIPLQGREVSLHPWLSAAQRDWIMVGLAEGTVAHNTVSGNMTSLAAANIEKDTYNNGKLSFFAKGSIQGKWLLTLAYNSDKDITERTTPFQAIDPNAYYPVYGDKTVQGYDASSREKLYVRLERRQFYALFGDYQTGMTVTDLARYDRTLTGYKSELRSDHYKLNVFASQTNQVFVKDEIRGDGTSGLYHLRNPAVIANSETIRIETRDRFRPQIVLSSQPMTRNLDYDIDYTSGSVFFKQPVASKDANLNPIFIVVDYETSTSNAKNWTYGGRGAVKFMHDKLEVGASYVNQGSPSGNDTLKGVDATLAISKATQLKLEYANSRAAGTQASDAYQAELRHNSNKLEGKVYFREQETGFGIGQQSTIGAGSRLYGADGTYHLTDRMDVTAQAFRQSNLDTDANRDVTKAGVKYETKNAGASAGLQSARDSYTNGLDNTSTQLLVGAHKSLLANRLNLRIDHAQSLSDNANPDYPTRTVLGADYLLNPSTSFFIEQEFTSGAQVDTRGTRIGMSNRPWTGAMFSTSVEQRSSENGQRLFANAGLKQTWQITDRWSMDASLDSSTTLKGKNVAPFSTTLPTASGNTEDFTAVSLGTTYQHSNWSWTGRIERRIADSEDKWGIYSASVGEPHAGLGLSGRLQWYETQSSNGTSGSHADLRLGLVRRPFGREWTFLNRTDLVADRQAGSSSDFDNRKLVNNLLINYRRDSIQVSTYYGAKYSRDTIDNAVYSGYTDSLGVELRKDLNKRWDLGARMSTLHSWNTHQYEYTYGLSVGFNPATNLWLSLGYNWAGFDDNDFSMAGYNAQGVYLTLRFKFDQQSIRDVAGWFNRQ